MVHIVVLFILLWVYCFIWVPGLIAISNLTKLHNLFIFWFSIILFVFSFWDSYYISIFFFPKFSNITKISNFYFSLNIKRLFSKSKCLIILLCELLVHLFSMPVAAFGYGHDIITPCITAYFWHCRKIILINLKLTWRSLGLFYLSNIIYHSADGLMVLLSTGHLIPIHDWNDFRLFHMYIWSTYEDRPVWSSLLSFNCSMFQPKFWGFYSHLSLWKTSSSNFGSSILKYPQKIGLYIRLLPNFIPLVNYYSGDSFIF